MQTHLEITRKFGSFHSSNIEEQIKVSETDDYSVPHFPVKIFNFNQYKNSQSLIFGCSFKEKHFYLDDNYTFLNHGAFGSVLKEAMQTLQGLQIYIEKQPVSFIDREMFPLIVFSQKELAAFVGCMPSDIAFVENATMGTNIVLNSLKYQANDTIYCLSTAYGAVKKSLHQVKAKYSVSIQQETVNFPLSSDADIVDLVSNTLKANTKLAVFDHVPSNTAFVMPVEKIIKVCHEKNVPVLIDGAHALGALPLNLAKLEADYYVSNAHKWFCAPKGCAFLYVKPHLQCNITALSVSHGYGFGYQSELTYTGLKDYSPYIALICCLNFWNAIGPEVIRSWINKLLCEAVTLLKKKWKGHLLAPLEMHSTMCCVSLPKIFKEEYVAFEQAELIQNRLFHEHHIEVPIKCIDGKLYVRISCHLYNDIKEYEKLSDAILNLQKTSS